MNCQQPKRTNEFIKRVVFYIIIVLMGTLYLVKDESGNNFFEKMTNYSKKMQLELKQQKE